MIQLEHVSKIYERGGSRVTALDDASLKIERGEFVSVIGPSGSGKTTLLQILGCLDVPTEGRYTLAGVPVDELDDDALSRLRNQRIGFVFQSFNLLPRTTALENVEAPLLYSDDPPPATSTLEVLDRVGMAHRKDHFPGELSAGEQQRVAIARAIVMNPALLLADEPTGNLDSATGDEILSLFEELHAHGLTMVIVTHNPGVAARAQRTIVLRDGRIQTPQQEGIR